MSSEDDSCPKYTGEDMRQHFLVQRDGHRMAAKWYINAARIYRDSAISYSEKLNRYWANLYIDAAEDCFCRGKKLRAKSISVSIDN